MLPGVKSPAELRQGARRRAHTPGGMFLHPSPSIVLGPLLERQGILSDVLRERQWRQLFIRGVTPEQAVERAQVYYNNTRPAFERWRKR
jgi:hypothetical protein